MPRKKKTTTDVANLSAMGALDPSKIEIAIKVLEVICSVLTTVKDNNKNAKKKNKKK